MRNLLESVNTIRGNNFFSAFFFRLVAILLITITVTGCGTLVTRSDDPYFPHDWRIGNTAAGEKPSRIYSGITMYYYSHVGPEGAILALIDLPMCFVADTLLLPVTIYEQFIIKNELQLVSTKGDINAIREILASGVNINAKDAYGHTALMSATWAGHAEVVKLLLEDGADVNEQNKHNRATALMYSANHFTSEKKSDNASIVNLLLNAGADGNIRNTSGRTALMLAAVSGNSEVVKVLLNKGVDVNTTDEYGQTALAYALGNTWQYFIFSNYSSTGMKPEIVQMLKSNGAQ